MTGLVLPDGRPLRPDIIRTGHEVEQRAPIAATLRQQYLGPGQAQTYTWNAESAVRRQLMANIVVYRCVKLIAQIVGSLPFRAGIAPPKRPGMTADHTNDGPLARFLSPPPGGPAPKLSARRLWAWTATQRIVTGRHAWELELATGTKDIVAMWPLVSAHVKAVPTMSGVEWFRAFEISAADPMNPKRLSVDQVHYGWDPHPEDFRQAESALEAAKLSVELSRMMDVYNVAFLRNDARPASLVVTEQFATRDDYERFKNELNDLYGGPYNAGKTMVVEAEGAEDGKVSMAVDVKQLGLSHKDSLFLEQHRAALEHVAIALGVPWSMLDAAGRTFDNASEESEHFWRNTIVPLCETLADDVNLDLSPRLGNLVGWFDFSGVEVLRTRSQPVTQTVGAPAMTQGQLMTINEARADYGLDPLPGADRLMTAEEIVAIRGGGATAEVTLREAPVPEQRQPEPTPEPAAVVPENRAPDPEEIEARRAKIWRKADATVTTIERRWESAFHRLFVRQERTTIARLEGKRGRQMARDLAVRAPGDPGDVESIFDPAYWTDETREAATDLYETVVAAGQGRVAELFDVAFDLTDPEPASFITARSNQLAGQVTDTTYRAIQRTLAEGAEGGEAIPKLSDRIREVFAEATKNRTTVIARTEVISAYNGASSMSAAMLPPGVVGGQEWISTRDGRTRSAHASADGQITAMGVPFQVGGDQLLYPGDPSGRSANTIQCRCTVAFLTPEEYVAAIAERGRTVPYGAARAILTMLRRDTPDDRIRQALQEIAA